MARNENDTRNLQVSVREFCLQFTRAEMFQATRSESISAAYFLLNDKTIFYYG